MQNTLVDLVKTLQAGMASSSSGSSSHPPQMGAYPQPGFQGQGMGFSPGRSEQQYPHPTSTGSGPTPPFYTMPGNPSFLAQSPSTSAGSFHQPQNTGMNWGGASNAQYANTHNIDPSLLSVGAPSDPQRNMGPPAPPQSNQWQQASKQNLHMSLPPSRGGSVTPDDLLAPEEIINPLGAMTNMAGLVEAAVARARNEQATPSAHAGASAEGQVGEDGGSAKRRRDSPTVPHGPFVVEAQNLPPQSTKEKIKKAGKKRHMHAYPDAVEEGFVSEQEGKDLMAM